MRQNVFDKSCASLTVDKNNMTSAFKTTTFQEEISTFKHRIDLLPEFFQPVSNPLVREQVITYYNLVNNCR